VTVAAVILAASAESALADAAGRPAVRRIVDSAWAGGAVPIVVVSDDPTGAVAATLAGSPASLVPPAQMEAGPLAQIVWGIDAARAEVTETEAALLVPARMVWIDAETVTSLVEGHGADRTTVLRPEYAGVAGWPVLLPIVHLAALAALGADRTPGDLVADLAATGVPLRTIDLGDPGSTFDGSVPIEELPEFEGPSAPAGGPPSEWGAGFYDQGPAPRAGGVPDVNDSPLGGPGMAPFGQAADEEAAGRD
jgi:CTP:molybdopterin cytidylyltransferase MocA